MSGSKDRKAVPKNDGQLGYTDTNIYLKNEEASYSKQENAILLHFEKPFK